MDENNGIKITNIINLLLNQNSPTLTMDRWRGDVSSDGVVKIYHRDKIRHFR